MYCALRSLGTKGNGYEYTFACAIDLGHGRGVTNIGPARIFGIHKQTWLNHAAFGSG